MGRARAASESNAEVTPLLLLLLLLLSLPDGVSVTAGIAGIAGIAGVGTLFLFFRSWASLLMASTVSGCPRDEPLEPLEGGNSVSKRPGEAPLEPREGLSAVSAVPAIGVLNFARTRSMALIGAAPGPRDSHGIQCAGARWFPRLSVAASRSPRARRQQQVPPPASPARSIHCGRHRAR